MAHLLLCTFCGCPMGAEALFCEHCGERVSQAQLADARRPTAATDVGGLSRAVPAALPLRRTRAATSTWLVPFNAAVWFGGTVVSVLDFFSPRIVLLPMAAAVTASALLLLILARQFVAPGLSRASKLRRVLAPDVVFHTSPSLVVASVFAALTATGAAWSGASSARGGVIASNFDMARGVQMQLGILHGMPKEQRVQTAVPVDIRDGLQHPSAAAGVTAKSTDKKTSAVPDRTAVIRNMVTREPTPFEALAAQGYGSTQDDLCAALMAGNTKAMDLFLKIGFKSHSLVGGTGSYTQHCLEKLFLNVESRVKLQAVAAHFPFDVRQLNRQYYSVYADDGDRHINAQSLRAVLGWHSNTGKFYIEEKQATPLLLSVWGDNIDAASFLLKLGVNKNNGGNMRLSDFSQPGKSQKFIVMVSPLSEAKRLGRTEIAALLTQYNAEAKFSKIAIKD